MVPRAAILGTGPSALYLSLLLSQKGWDVRVYDPKMPWENPRGSGIALDALRRFPCFEELKDGVTLTTLKVLSPRGREGRIECNGAFRIISREEVAKLLDRWARDAGVEILSTKIDEIKREGPRWKIRSEGGEWDADFLVGADGAVSLARKTLGRIPPSREMTIEVGYDLPMVIDGGHIGVIKFLQEIPGCFWAMPSNAQSTSVRLWATARLLHARNLFEKIDMLVQDILEIPAPGESGRTVAQIPLFEDPRPDEVQGDGWALIADAAGLVHPLSQDGLYFGLRSASVLADSFQGGRLDEVKFRDRLRREVMRPLKRRVKRRRWWRHRLVLDWMIGRLAKSEKNRKVFFEMIDPRSMTD